MSRYNNRRDLDDAGRFDLAVSQIVGKRITFDQITGVSRIQQELPRHGPLDGKVEQADYSLARFFFARLRCHSFSCFFSSSRETERTFLITASNFETRMDFP
jgi:hypothetical protein